MFYDLLFGLRRGAMYSTSGCALHKASHLRGIIYIIYTFNILAFRFIPPLDLQINLCIYYDSFPTMAVKYLALKEPE